MGDHSCSTAAWSWPERVGVAGEAAAETIADELVIATMAIGAGSGCELATKVVDSLCTGSCSAAIEPGPEGAAGGAAVGRPGGDNVDIEVSGVVAAAVGVAGAADESFPGAIAGEAGTTARAERSAITSRATPHVDHSSSCKKTVLSFQCSTIFVEPFPVRKS